MTTHDVHLALDQERHDAATESSLAALDAEEARLAVTVALDALVDANQVRDDAKRAVMRAEVAQRVAVGAYQDALDARDAEMYP